MMRDVLIEFGIRHPKLVMFLSIMITLVFLAAFPSLKTNTDPLKMLPQDNPAITLHEHVKSTFNIKDIVVMGINTKDGSSLFTPEKLERIHKIILEIKEIRDEPPSTTAFMKFFRKLQFLKDHQEGSDLDIIDHTDIFSISTIDDILLNKSGELLLSPLMKTPPKTQEDADRLLQNIQSNPLLKGKLAARDGSLIGIYIPLMEGKKERSYYLSQQIRKIAEKYLSEDENYYIAGLPVAENTFGNEMFIQMGVYAPAAGLVIFLLLLFFFRNIRMVISPMLLSMLVVIWSMGALIYAGQAIHIMSSMIPIFLMPIAVLDSVHILSTLHSNMQKFKNREEAVRHVMHDLFNPMLFTSITTFVGFFSLSTTGIPPVMVFGVTIAFGVFLAWLLSMVFIPAYVMLLSEKATQNFGQTQDDKKSSVMEVVQIFKGIASKAPHVVVIVAILSFAVSIFGIQQIIINDNPVRWFKEGHELRKADVIMNQKLSGTYMSNLYLTIPGLEPETVEQEPVKDANASENAEEGTSGEDEFPEDEFGEDEFGEETAPAGPSIRDPQVIAYIDRVSKFLIHVEDGEGNKAVGGVTSIIDILGKVGAVAFQDASLPETREKVSQYMFLFESGDPKRGRDMWKFITPGEGSSAQVWVQFKTGDNQNMNLVIRELDKFLQQNPPPTLTKANGESVQLQVKWSGLTYINKVWQDEMVRGMTYALAGSFLIVFLMMAGLFRSPKWGLVAMLPLTLTIVMIYGVIGFSGKFYDMPIAVLSSLTLGLSIDFAIHFIQNIRQIHRKTKNFEKTLTEIFEETAQAIWRNVLVISIGFAPLFFASLVPYVTVGFFFFGIMIVSGITTLILLPVIVKLFHKWLPGLQ